MIRETLLFWFALVPLAALYLGLLVARERLAALWRWFA